MDKQIIPHAFLRTPQGTLISFDAPGADLNPGDDGGTVAYAINNLGVIAGQYEDTQTIFHGFIRYPDGRIFEYNEPNAGNATDGIPDLGTIPANINLQGDTAAYYFDDVGNEHGFIRYHNGTFVTVDPPNSLETMICLETCLTDDGTVTEFFFDGSTGTYRGFIRSSQGAYTVFDGPEVDDQPGQGTVSASINPQHTTGGYFVDYLSITWGRPMDSFARLGGKL